MPFAFIIVGIVMVISAVRGTSDDLLALLKGDVTGPNNYLYWVVSILVIGAIGYAPKLRGLSRAFLVLVIVVLFLHNRGFFAKFQAQFFAPSTAGAISGAAGGPTVAQTTTSNISVNSI